MIELFYTVLERVGFTHPVHPAITHIPMGMVMGAFIFTLAAWRLQKDDLMRTAHHCAILALIFVIPTAIAGYMDWQYRFDAEMSVWIVLKIILAASLLVGLVIAVLFGNFEDTRKEKMLIIYGICLGMCIGLGFSGGELQYG